MSQSGEKKEPIGNMFVAPSLTSYDGGWPRYRIYKVNKRTLEVLDFTNYYIDLDEANKDTTK